MLGSLKVAVRSLSRRPAVAVVAVISLAVGIGVNSAVFSIVDALFLRPPAIHDPDSLVYVSGHFHDSGDAVVDWSDYQDIAGQTPAFSGTTAYMRRGGMWRNGEELTLLLVNAVADNYFELLGVQPALGRFPDAMRDYGADPEPPLVLTNWFWRERMGARPDVIGQTMQFRDHVFRIAAILPAQFRGVEALGLAHVWIPIGSWSRYFKTDLGRGSGQFEVLARLRPGASIEQAQAQLDLVARRIESADSRVPKGRALIASSVGQQVRNRFRPGILIMAVVCLVLLVACANVASVLLAYAEARRREIGVRLALGAGRLALLRQFLAESAVLAAAGAAGGLLLAVWLISLTPALAPPSRVPLNFDFRIDTRLLLFTASAAITTLMIFGLAPLVYSLRVSLLDALGARVAGRSSKSVARFAFVTAQVALSVVIVAGAIVFVRALTAARGIYPGYDTARPLALLFANTDSKRPENTVYEEAATRVAAVGGVEAVTFARHLPLVDSGSGAAIAVVPEGARPDSVPPRVYFNLVGPRFFEIMGTRLTSGRPFSDSDHHGGAPVAIVTAEAARRFWPGGDPVGKTLRIQNKQYQVIGVAADIRISSLHEPLAPAVFLPASRMEWGETILIARTRADPAALVKELARTAGRTPGLKVYESMTLRTLRDGALYEDWIATVLGCALAAIGLLLAAGGLYGAVAYAAQRRMSEFGVRLAVGARAAQIGVLVFTQAGLICCAGVPIGVGLFAACYRYYGATLLRNRPLDAIAMTVGAAVTIAVVLSGAIVPAIRAARLDPIQVLHSE